MTTTPFTAIPLLPGANWAELPEARRIQLPADLVSALDQARGALIRTVYLVTDDNRTAFGLGFHRAHTAQEKLTRLSGDPDLIGRLLDQARRHAQRAGAVVVKAELDPHDTDAITAAIEHGFVRLRPPNQPGPVPAGWDATPAGVIHPGQHLPAQELSYYRQTTDITCGSVALLTALHGLGLHPSPTRSDELQAWRASTLIPDADAHGLALVAQHHGAGTTVVANRTGPLTLDPTLSGWELELRQDLHDHLAEQARQVAKIEIRTFGIDSVLSAVAAGGIVVLLINQQAMNAVPCPHWVTVHGCLGDTLLIDDPWTDAELGESWVDAHHLPIHAADLHAMAVWDQYRAMIAMSATPA